MKTCPDTIAIVPAAKRIVPAFNHFFRFHLVLGLLLTLCVARVQAQDDDYMAIYSTIEQADALNASGKTAQAHDKYVEAKKAMATFQQTYPAWNTSTVNFRQKYLDEKIAATKGGRRFDHDNCYGHCHHNFVSGQIAGGRLASRARS